MSSNLVHYFHAEYSFKPSSLTWISGGKFNNSSNCVVLRFLKGLEQKENIGISGKRKNPVRNDRSLYFGGKSINLTEIKGDLSQGVQKVNYMINKKFSNLQN
jgi:hypothetical protein